MNNNFFNDKIINRVIKIETNLQALSNIIINHSKILRELENEIDKFDALTLNLKDEYKKIKKINKLKVLLNNKKDKKIEKMDKTINDINVMIKESDIINLRKKFDNFKDEIYKINSSTESLHNEIVKLQTNSSTSSEQQINNKIIDLVNNYHDYVKNNIRNINNRIEIINKKTNQRRINLKIDNLTIDNQVILIEKNIKQIRGHMKIDNMIIKEKKGIIMIDKFEYSEKNIMGKIKIVDNTNNKIYRGIITNKAIIADSNDELIYILEDNDIITNTYFDGFIEIKIKFYE